MPETAPPLVSTSTAPWAWRTPIAAALGVLVVAAAGAAVGSAIAEAQIRTDQGAAALRAARAMADGLSSDMAARVREVDLLSRLDLFRDGNGERDAIRQTLAGLADGLPAYAWMGLTDADGRVVAGIGGVLEGQSIAARPVFRNGRAGAWTGDVHDAVMLAALAPRRPGEAAPRFIDVAAPVAAADGSFRGVLALHLSWQWADKMRAAVLKTQADAPGLQLGVVGADGSTLLGVAADADAQAAVPTLRATTLQSLDDRADEVAWADGATAVSAAAPSRPTGEFKGFGWHVVARVDPAATASAIDAAERKVWQWSLSAGVVGGALVAGFLGTRGGWPGSSRRPGDAGRRAERRRAALDTTPSFARLRDAMDLGSTRRDVVTGLPTRVDLGHLADALARMPADDGMDLCVLCLDLDDFRAVNDRHGRPAGDAALRQVAARLVSTAREDDVVLRLGGDEFVVIAPCAPGQGEEMNERIATRLLLQLRRPLTDIGGASPMIGACVGSARWRPAGAGLLESVAQAEEALMAAKRAGRCQIRHYAATPSGVRARRLEARVS